MSPLPPWLKKPIPKHSNISRVRKLMGENGVHTVCESAKCPNIGECFAKNTVTFLILGDTCTRRCAFCGVKKGIPAPVDPDEPKKIAEAVKKLGLDYVVITSVTRDDLPDGGAGQFVEVIRYLRLNAAVPEIEVLIPDNLDLDRVLEAKPFVLNHNLETVPRLYPQVRPQADYRRSLKVLRYIKDQNPSIYTKSGIMVGLGEKDEEIEQVLRDLRAVGCDLVTIGQYLPPAKQKLPVIRYVDPLIFAEYERLGKELGFLHTASGPFVRSSYRAGDLTPVRRSSDHPSPSEMERGYQ
ncbi:lipoyl synthase [Candidatus Saganbacteria bacterium]|nr:lipoyl synthase [Candidatus Saganbacteria bacterium]